MSRVRARIYPILVPIGFSHGEGGVGRERRQRQGTGDGAPTWGRRVLSRVATPRGGPISIVSRTARRKWSSSLRETCRPKRARRLRAAGKVPINNKCASTINFRRIIYRPLPGPLSPVKRPFARCAQGPITPSPREVPGNLVG